MVWDDAADCCKRKNRIREAHTDSEGPAEERTDWADTTEIIKLVNRKVKIQAVV